MNGKLSKTINMLAALIISGAFVYICVNGFFDSRAESMQSDFLKTGLKCIMRFIVVLAFFFSSGDGHHGSLVFIPRYMTFSLLTEIPVFLSYEYITYSVYVNDSICSMLYIVGFFMTGFMVLGYGAFYEKSKYKDVSQFFIAAIAVSAIIVLTIPVQQTPQATLQSDIYQFLLVAVFASALISVVMNLMHRTSASNIVRHFSVLLLLGSDCMNLFPGDKIIIEVVKLICFFAGCLMLVILSKVSEIKY